MLTFYLRHAVDTDQGDRVWNDVANSLQQSWGSRLNLQRRSSGLVATSFSPLVPLAMLKEASEIMAELSGTAARTKYPPTIIVDTGEPENFVARLEGEYKTLQKPWELYASMSAFEEMRSELDSSADLRFDETPNSRYGLLVLDENEHFLFAKALTRGGQSPCFYCGSRKHAPAKCPSKQLFSSRVALETLGHSSLSYANSCFLRYLTYFENENEPVAISPYSDLKDERISLAHVAFYDIKHVFQLRFFGSFFGADHLDWERICRSKGQHGQGGPAWLALDCLRVGDLDKAKHYAEIGMERDSVDWKPPCICGFLLIEKGELGRAEGYFEKALDLGRRIPQKILLNLLLARVNWLDGETQKARERARSALLLDRWCYDALYQLIALDFGLAKNEQPLQGLDRLTRQNGYYWIQALIDPDLAPYSAEIHPCLSRIAAEARHESEILSREAQKEFRGVRALLGTDFKILHEAQDLASSLDNKPNGDGYLDSTEKLHGARALKTLCQKAMDGQKQELKKALGGLTLRIDELNRLAGAIGGGTPPACVEALNILKTSIENARRSAAINFVNAYRDIVTQREAYAAQLDEIERDLKAWRTRKQLTAFFIRFLIRTSGFLFITFTFALSFPLFMAAIQTWFPQLKVSLDDSAPVQRIFIVFGALTSLAIAAVSSYSKTYGSRGRERVDIAIHKTRTEPAKKQVKAGR